MAANREAKHNPVDVGAARREPTRRQFLGSASALALFPFIQRRARAQVGANIVVVGGGFAGATVAKYLKLWGGQSVGVTLIDRRNRHTSCVMSNLVLNKRLRLSDLSFDYDSLAQRYGVEVVKGRVVEIHDGLNSVRLKDGRRFDYDHLVLAPGVAFDRVPGWSSRRHPHAWIAGRQTKVLRDQIREMASDGVFVMTVPKSPYRCPPGPYERACLVADILGRRSGVIGSRKRQGGIPKVVVLDANPQIQAERETFGHAFSTIYRDIIEYHPGVELEAVDEVQDRVFAVTSAGEFEADVLNVIPRHRAPRLISDTGLTSEGRWAPVDPLSYESLFFPSIHVIGDSQDTGQPKSGHMANAQAKVCADAILRMIAGRPVDSVERAANITTNSACYSPITYDEASWLTAAFAYNPATASMALTPDSLGEAGTWNKENFREMFSWSENLFADTFK